MGSLGFIYRKICVVGALLGSANLFATEANDSAESLKKIIALQQSLINELQNSKPKFLSDLPTVYENPASPALSSPQRDKVFWNSVISAPDGSRFTKAIGMHPPQRGVTQADWKVPEGFHTFHTLLVDVDSCAGLYQYRILTKAVGGTMFVELARYESSPITRSLDLKVGAADILRLEVDSLGINDCDHATFVDAQFIKRD